MAGACSSYGAEQRCIQVLVGKLEGNRPNGRHSRRRENNVKMDLRNVGCGGMDCFDLSQDKDRWRALVNDLMKFRFL